MNTQWQDHISGPSYDLAVVIGRFQPFHHGHKVLVDHANKIAKKTLVVIGSAFIARNSKNPFTTGEREQMIRANFSNEENDRMEFGYAQDDLYNDQTWIAYIQNIVAETVLPGTRVAIVGHHKDDSSYYLDMFPKYDVVEVPNVDSLNSTDIRTSLYETSKIESVPGGTQYYIIGWTNSNRAEFERLREEHEFIKNYKKQFEALPYPPIFVTSDAVVICNGHILLVKRRAAPGKGLWALPGGFLNVNERIEECIVRELEEETRIKVSTNILKASLKGTHVFDAPGRSLRGRTITHAGLFILREKTLPKVRGSDDAEKAKWVPISEFYEMSDQMYEDHFSIGTYMINRAG